MLTIGIILCLAATGNIAWSYWNWRVHQNRTQFYRMMDDLTLREREKSVQLLRTAIRTAAMSTTHQEHKVCSVCNRIVALHEMDESGKTVCANCMLQRTKDIARANHG